jgi:hypothetical protein
MHRRIRQLLKAPNNDSIIKFHFIKKNKKIKASIMTKNLINAL